MRLRWPLLSMLGMIVAAGPCAAQQHIHPGAAAPPSVVEPPRWLPFVFRPQLNALESEIAAIDGRLVDLPQAGFGNTTGSLGLHSRIFQTAGQQSQVTLDLLAIHVIDRVALVPARALIGNTATPGYGFPPRFRIDIASHPDFRDRHTIADHTREDLPGPRHYPYLTEFPPRPARYVRLTVTRNWQRGPNMWLWALAEIMVLSGSDNVALRKPLKASEGRPRSTRWAPEFLVDGITPLGIPENITRSRSNGYHSLISATRDNLKWVQVDLEQSLPIDQVRLIPAFPVDWLDTAGFGFPVRFRVQAADHPSFAGAVTLFDTGPEPYPPPGNNPVIINGDDQKARYVRVTALELYASGPTRHLFALAELEVVSSGKPVSYGRPVQAMDSFAYAPRPFWKPEFLTDGFSSERQLLPLDVWLRQLSRRQVLESRKEILTRQHRVEMQAAAGRFRFLAIALVSAAFGIPALLWYLGWRDRRLQMQAIRAQIARDLHDEVGSNLAAVMHWAGALESEAEAPAMRSELGQIRRVAKETSDSLHDLVWMLHNSDGSAADLAAQMEQVARGMLRGRNVEVRAAPPARTLRVSLQVRRNAMLAFREVLSNVLKHSDSRNVRVTVTWDEGRIRFRVVDDGKGFDPAAVRGGWGIRNLRKRADALKGEVRVESAPGAGAAIEFEAPLG